MTDQREINKTVKTLYKKWPDVKVYLKSLGCKQEDAEDIFQEAIVLFLRKREEADFKLDVEPFFYVKSTSKFLWFNKARKENKTISTENFETLDQEESNWLAKENKLKTIENIIAEIGDKCQQLLKMYYTLKMSMQEIAKKLDLRNDKVAKAQKYRCINKVKEKVNLLHDFDYSPQNLKL